MARERIGVVTGGKSGKKYAVGYDASARAVYVDVGGLIGSTWVSVAKANDPQSAMRAAAAYVWDR